MRNRRLMESGTRKCESLMSGARKLGLVESGSRECKLTETWAGKRKRGRPKGSKNRVVSERRVEFEYQEEDTRDHMMDEIDNGEAKRLKLEGSLFKQNSKNRGNQVKEAAQVLKVRLNDNGNSQLRVHCRVNAFGKLCKSFDERRKKWVRQMGFGGLLFLMDSWLPMNLCYWLMTRMDPFNQLFISPDGHEYKLSKDQVRWILGIPKGSKVVPRKVTSTEMRSKVSDIERKFGKEWELKRIKSGRVNKLKGIVIEGALLEKAKGSWEEEDEEEFKTLFLILALHMILCPPLSSVLDNDLLPALSCAKQAWNYDWCGLVLEKLFDSAYKFGNKFYADGFAKGCGGCSIFLAIFYLDRLHRDPVMWGKWPRIKAWTKEEMVKAEMEDRVLKGDFGNTGCIDVAYGEEHPWEAKDMDDLTSFPEEGLGLIIRSQRPQEEEASLELNYVGYNREKRTSEMNPMLCKLVRDKQEESLLASVPNKLAQTTEDPILSMVVKGGQFSQSGGNSRDDDAQEEVSQPQKSPTLSLIDHGKHSSCCVLSFFNADVRSIEGEQQSEDSEEDGNRDGRNIPLAKEVLEGTKCIVMMQPLGGNITPSTPVEVTNTSHNLDGSTDHSIKGAPSCLASLCTVDADLDNPGIIKDDEASENFNPFEVVSSELECRISKLESVFSRKKAAMSKFKQGLGRNLCVIKGI
ncbi:uncharacterized protein LOC110723801 [Chenopodium quinoa]|uniref:uncharacterized protein LOC110723801 n=1 Tax=Chenopodium quinoa TaxID=63459 RepID=UPI000B77B291|nr:uncharacterized protein LOC110723801 [Chenopodium quinoa]